MSNLRQKMKPPITNLEHVMKRFQESDHTHGIVVCEVQAGGFLQSIVPHFMPQDGNPNELATDEQGLREEISGKGE